MAEVEEIETAVGEDDALGGAMVAVEAEDGVIQGEDTLVQGVRSGGAKS